MGIRAGLIVAVPACAVLLVTASAAPRLAAQEPEAPQVFRSQASGVAVDVSVRQGSRPVSDLKASDFVLLDNGVKQQIAEVSYERLPIDVAVALDVSSSVSGATLDRLRQSIDQLRTRLRDGDRLKLMTFNIRVHRVIDFTDRSVDTRQVFGTLSGTGGTSLFDALSVALTSATPPDRRQLVIVFTDGQDTSSFLTAKSLAELVRRSTPTIDFVRPALAERYQVNIARADGQTSSVARPGAETDMWRLHRQIAADTGGVVLDSAATNLADSFASVLDYFRSSYVLRYTARGANEPGFHTITVQVTRSGTFDIHARRGYFAD